ncbi:DUF2059 domain-containing protein [Pseudoduganella eburnea]|uniref:DUF2059 domain-containing protein n=1 Tax=Massilia eburnea TaxID=1776165 RepID=A0A6L6QEZ0_9BURK|nr:DUF2059 domain-containing protein [Massilia eburnea]MTW10624.1 DUF2059 domain-containing protein [Massilia eburnea]
MKKFAVSLVAAFAFVSAHAADKPAAPAPNPAVVSAVSKLLDSMNYRSLMEQTMKASMQQMEPAMAQTMEAAINANKKLNAEQKAQALELAKSKLPVMVGKMRTMFADPALIDEMQVAVTQIYARNYSLEEINQLAAFYRTPLGKKMMAKTPAIAAESMAVSQQIVMPRVEKLMAEVMEVFE